MERGKGAGRKPGQRVQQPPPSQQQYDYFLVLDFEATCVEGDNKRFTQEIIELPIVVLDARTGARLGEFREHVRPVVNPVLSPFCTQLTGIQQATVDSSDEFPAVFKRACAFVKQHLYGGGGGGGGAGGGDAAAGSSAGGGQPLPRALFLTCGDWDLQLMLPRQARLSGLRVPPLWQLWCNLKVPFGQLAATLPGAGSKKLGGMAGMLEALGLPLEGRHHCGIDDTRNIAAIAWELVRRGAVLQPTHKWPPELRQELGG